MKHVTKKCRAGRGLDGPAVSPLDATQSDAITQPTASATLLVRMCTHLPPCALPPLRALSERSNLRHREPCALGLTHSNIPRV